MKTIRMRLLKIGLLILTTLICVGVNAQKARGKSIKASYIAAPSKKLPSDYKTYSVNISGPGYKYGGMTNSPLLIEKNVKMNSLKRVEKSTGEFGHLRIEMYCDDIHIWNPEYRTTKKTRTSKEGVKSTYTEYYYLMTYTQKAYVRILDPQGNPLFYKDFSSKGKRKGKVETQRSSLIAQKDRNFANLKKVNGKSVIDKMRRSISVAINRDFDYVPKKERLAFYMLKKHSSEADFEKYFNEVDAFLTETQPEVKGSEYISRFSEAIEFWKKHGEKVPTDKKEKNVYLAANMNLASIYLIGDKLDESEKILNHILATFGGRQKDAQSTLEFLKKVRVNMNIQGITTMHFTHDLSNIVLPSVIVALEEAKGDLDENNNSVGGSYTINGEKKECKVYRVKDEGDFVFGDGGNTSFKREQDLKLIDINIWNDAISEFSIGERRFVKLNFSACAKGKKDPQVSILEVLYGNDKVSLYTYYPKSGSMTEDKKEFAIKKATDIAPISTLDAKFLLFNKGMANHFLDCSDLKEACESGSFKNNEEGLMNIVRIYAEACK